MGDFWCYIAFILGLLGLLVGFGALGTGLIITLALVTVVCALISLAMQLRMAEKNGIAMALSGLAIAMSLASLYLGIWGPDRHQSGKVDTAMDTMRDLGAAIDRYRKDQGEYPMWGSGDQTINFYIIPPRTGWQVYPSFRAWALPSDQSKFRLLTTPTAYISELPIDPFMMPTGATFSYYSDGGGWILLSPGPDGDYDINPQQVYSSALPGPSEIMIARQYDPTNGVKSDGDIFLTSAQMNQ